MGNKVYLNSLMYWYEKIKDLPIPQPKTLIYRIPKKYLDDLYEEHIPEGLIKEILPYIKKIGYPIFIRTDWASAKHSWKNSCYLEKRKDLIMHLYEIIVANLCADFFGLPFRAFVFREYIPLKAKFTAFYGDLPIAKERRIFIKDGKIQCEHPYWFPSAIENPSIDNWKEELLELNKLSKKDSEILEKYVLLVAGEFEGYWSIDFAFGNNGKWYLIDMAVGELSFHYLDCEFCPNEMRRRYGHRWNEEK